MDDDAVIRALGPRLRALRQARGSTLVEVAEATGISVSTLSRLESGERRPTLELLLPLARALDTPFDELVGVPAPEDPRVRTAPVRRRGRTLYPLTRRPGSAVQAYKMVVPPLETDTRQQKHPGYEWIYVLSGRVRLRLGELDVTLRAGEVAEFDTRTAHWFGAAGSRPAELLVLFGPQGERIHVRARSRAS